MGLSYEAKRRCACVTPVGKYKFKNVPFGLAQVAAHFQCVMNKVSLRLVFASGKLNDVLIFSPKAENPLTVV